MTSVPADTIDLLLREPRLLLLLGAALSGAMLLLLGSVLALVVRNAAPRRLEEKLRLQSEQILAAMRSETETMRSLMAASERALAQAQGDAALRTEQRLAEVSAAQAAAAAAQRQAIEARLGQMDAQMERKLGETRSLLETRLGDVATLLARGHGEARALLESKLREMAEHTAQRLAEIQKSVNEQLHEAVEKQMQTSFQRVADQLGAVQRAMVDVQAVTAQIGDIKRIFSNVKARGGWGEAQLRAQIDDILSPEAYVMNARLRENSAEVVEFAIKIPGRGQETPLLLAIDAKFPISDYERLLGAAEAGDAEAERAARRALETRLRGEARKIAEKYIVANVTAEFAVMYLPSDGLYAEAARIPGLIDDLGRNLHVMVMGPSVLPALLRTVRLSAMTLQLEERAAEIAKLLGATKQEMGKMDAVLERLARNANAMGKTIEDARTRTRAVTRKLRGLELMSPEEGARLLELEAEPAEDTGLDDQG